MIERWLPLLLRVTGVGLILLAVLHVPISRKLRWREQAARMSAENASIFQVHAFFICVVLVMMGLPSVLDPAVFTEKSRAGAWISWSVSGCCVCIASGLFTARIFGVVNAWKR